MKHFFLSYKNQFFKYFIAGASTVILDFLSLIFLKEILKFTAVQAVSINQVFVWFYNFNLNKYWSFNNYSLPHWQYAKYFILAGFNYSVSVFSMFYFHQSLGFNYLTVRLSSILLIAVWNFFLYKYWIYDDRK